MDDDEPALGTPPDTGQVLAATRAGSQANRFSIELAEAAQGLVRSTADTPAIPASEVYAVLGHLSAAGFGLAQGLEQLTACLSRSSDEGLYWAAGEDVADAERADTVMSMTAAVEGLGAAAEHAVQVGSLLAQAREDIAQEAFEVEVRLLRLRGSAPVELVEWLTPEEAADLLQVTESTLRSRQWREAVGAPPPHKDEQRRLRFREDEVLAFSRRRGAA